MFTFMFSHMILEMTSLTKSFVANFTLIRFLTSVFSHMNFQIASQSKHLIANLALVLFDSTMNIIAMGFHFKSASKCFRAFWTTEWFISGMDSHVTS